MPIKEAFFWVSITVFGTGLYFLPEHKALAILLIVVGLGGVAFSVAIHHWPDAKQPPLWIPLLLLTWAALGYSYYDRHREPLVSQTSVMSHPPLVKAWGADQGVCRELVDGSQLMKWADKYNVGFVCGIIDQTRDKFEDDRITVSQSFSIHPGDIAMAMPYSQQMNDAINLLVDEFENKVKGNAPKGTVVRIPIPYWTELVLLQKTTKMSDIRRLSDVLRYGGGSPSQGFPPP